MINLTSADAALKDYYLDAVKKEIQDKSNPFFAAIEKTSADVFGKDVKLSIINGATGSVAACDEDGDLPDPYANRYLSVTLPLKNIYGTIEITDKALRASKDGSGAFVNLLNTEMQGLVNSAKTNFSRMLFSDGNGYLFNIYERVSSYVYKATGLRASDVGKTIEIRSVAIPTNVMKRNVLIEEVDLENGTVTFDTVILASEGASIYANAYLNGSYGKEVMGLEALWSGTSLYGYNKAAESYLNAQKIEIEGVMTEGDLISAIDSIEEKFDSKPNMIIVSFATRKAIGNLIADSRRVVNSSDLAVGYGEITVAGIPVYADKNCAENTVYFINTDDFKLCQLCDWEWLEDEDGRILKQVPGKAAYSATLVKYAEVVCTRPCAQCKLVYTNAPEEETE